MKCLSCYNIIKKQEDECEINFVFPNNKRKISYRLCWKCFDISIKNWEDQMRQTKALYQNKTKK